TSYFQPVRCASGNHPRKLAMIFFVGTNSASNDPWRVEILPDLISLSSPSAPRDHTLPKEKSLTAAAWNTASIDLPEFASSRPLKSLVVVNVSTCCARRSPQ